MKSSFDKSGERKPGCFPPYFTSRRGRGTLQQTAPLRWSNNLPLVLLGRDLYRSSSNLPDQQIKVSLVFVHRNLKEQVHATGCAEGTAGKPAVSSSIVRYSI